jgi:signal transduction histidine kinase
MRSVVGRATVARVKLAVREIVADERARRAADVLLAAAITVASLVGVLFAHGGGSGWFGPRGLDVAAALLIGGPLAFRARRPLAVFALVFVGVLVPVLAAGRRQGPIEVFAALVIAAYSVGAHVGGRRERLGLAMVTVPQALAGAIVVASGHAGPGDFFFPTLLSLAAAWIVGRIIRGRRERTLELEALTRELEAQRDLQAQAAVAVERGRIARELHDIVAHNVSMMVVQAGAASRVLEGEQPHVRNALTAIADTGRETVDEMRQLLGVLRSSGDGLALSPQPGLRDLEELVRSLRDAGLPVDLRVEGPRVALPPAVDLSAFRIVQEALTNTLKHAGSARAQVTVTYRDGSVELEVRDDGRGNQNGGGSGHGLLGMRERVAMFGGDLEAGSNEHGFTVRARLPLSASTAA